MLLHRAPLWQERNGMETSNVKYVVMLLRFKQQKMNTRGGKKWLKLLLNPSCFTGLHMSRFCVDSVVLFLIRQPTNQSARQRGMGSSVLCLGWKKKKKKRSSCQWRRGLCVWRPGEIKPSCDSAFKEKRHITSLQITAGHCWMCWWDMWSVWVCMWKGEQTKCCFCFSDYTNGLGTEQILKEVMPHGPLETVYGGKKGRKIL